MYVCMYVYMYTEIDRYIHNIHVYIMCVCMYVFNIDRQTDR